MSSPPHSNEAPTQSRHTRIEWIVFAIICLIGVGLRCYRLDHLSIEHFDEGVYAANLYADLDDYKYPQRHLYAPPLFPLLCELAIGIGGTPDAAIWVNLLFGSLMLPLVWFVARDSFGTVAAIVAATLCATSDYHIFFSRSALTDVSLGFWLLLAVWLAGKGMRSGSGLTLGGAAIAAALAWWTKYNGWLAIAIPLGGWGMLAIVSVAKWTGPLMDGITGCICRVAVFRRLCSLSPTIGTVCEEDSTAGERAGVRGLGGAMRPPHPNPLPRNASSDGIDVAHGGEGAGNLHSANAPGVDRAGLVRWGMFAIVAALLWSPVVYGLQSVGGYSVVSKNHAGYLVGLGGWWDGLRMHFAYHGWLTSAVGVGGLLLVGTLLTVIRGRQGIGVAVAMSCLMPVASITGVGGVFSGVSFLGVVLIVRGWIQTAVLETKHLQFFEFMLVTWWVGLTLTTPLYTPYARLSLPWLVSNWLLVGVLASELVTEELKLGQAIRGGFFGLVILAMLFGPAGWRPESHFSTQPLGNLPAWSDRTGLRKATGQILHELDMGRRDMRPSEVAGYDAAVYVVGEPALFCHLSEASQASEMNLVVKPGANMSVAAPGPPLPTFIITGSHASSAEVEEVVATGRMELIWEQRVLVSDMVALDSASLQQLQVDALKSNQGPDHTIPIRIYRVRQ